MRIFTSSNLLRILHRTYRYSASSLVNDFADSLYSFSPNFQKENKKPIMDSFKVYKNFITPHDEDAMMSEIEIYVKRLVYEKDHWDGAIINFRETERNKWKKDSQFIINNMQTKSFSNDSKLLPYVHILDLAEDGHINPHIDSVKFCGDTVAVLSLNSDSIARLRLDQDKSEFVDIFIERRSLYVMKGFSRYKFTHEILKNDESYFNGEKVHKGRRISVVSRNEPNHDDVS